MKALRNTWYMAGWASEVGAKPLARRIVDEPVVLFRDEEGRPHALKDRCPHRFAPLSLGTVRGNAVECRYHGLAFDGSGACASNPHGPITSGLRVRSYPIVEAFRALWIWMGDPELADASNLRDLSFLSDAPDTAFSQGYLRGLGNYELFVDNILDLSHTDYLHPDTLGGGSFTATRAKVTEADTSVTLVWDARSVNPSPFTARGLPPGTKVDHWTEVCWSVPSVMTLRASTVPVGTPPEDVGGVANVHIMTPETADSTHYFYAATRNFALDDAEFNEYFAKSRDHIFATEDEPMIRAQYEAMAGEDFWSLQPQLLRIDEGAARVRRKLAAMIEAEQVEKAV